MDLNRVEVRWVRGIVWDTPVLVADIILFRAYF